MSDSYWLPFINWISRIWNMMSHTWFVTTSVFHVGRILPETCSYSSSVLAVLLFIADITIYFIQSGHFETSFLVWEIPWYILNEYLWFSTQTQYGYSSTSFMYQGFRRSIIYIYLLNDTFPNLLELIEEFKKRWTRKFELVLWCCLLWCEKIGILL